MADLFEYKYYFLVTSYSIIENMKDSVLVYQLLKSKYYSS